MPTNKTKDSLRKEIEELAKFPEMNPGPVLRLNTKAEVILANSAARKIFERDDLVGQSWLDLCPGLDPDEWTTISSCPTATGFEADLGGHCYLFTHVCPQDSENYFVFGSDVTQIKLIEKELESQRESLANMARFPDMNPGPVLRLKDDGEIILSNIAAKNVLGEDVVGRNWKEVCPGMDQGKWEAIIRTTDITNHEVNLEGEVFMFTHRKDPKTNFIFVYGADITEHKKTEKSLQQAEKMATLGTLAAGVAHELNNPAAATKRASEVLKTKLSDLEKVHIMLNQRDLSDDDLELIINLEKRALDHRSSMNKLDALTRSDREEEIEDWLYDKGYANDLDMAPELVDLEISVEQLENLYEKDQSGNLEAILDWLAIIYPVYSLLTEVSEGTSRISEIVGALKNYSFLGQAKLLNINLHEGLDNTLVILRNKMKEGVTVERDYDENVPEIMAYGSELNQVWTNLLDNAVDAMQGKGLIKIRTSYSDGMVSVEIEDNGKGIPEEDQPKIFDPFFTTKTIGKGTGLGLSTSYGIIVEKHKGQMMVSSEPGQTIFKVLLPVNFEDHE